MIGFVVAASFIAQVPSPSEPGFEAARHVRCEVGDKLLEREDWMFVPEPRRTRRGSQTFRAELGDSALIVEYEKFEHRYTAGGTPSGFPDVTQRFTLRLRAGSRDMASAAVTYAKVVKELSTLDELHAQFRFRCEHIPSASFAAPKPDGTHVSCVFPSPKPGCS